MGTEFPRREADINMKAIKASLCGLKECTAVKKSHLVIVTDKGDMFRRSEAFLRRLTMQAGLR